MSLFHFAELNPGLGFRTRSIIGSECSLISLQKIFSFWYRLCCTLLHPPHRPNTNRRSSLYFSKAHHDMLVLNLLVSIFPCGGLPDTSISDIRGTRLEERYLEFKRLTQGH